VWSGWKRVRRRITGRASWVGNGAGFTQRRDFGAWLEFVRSRFKQLGQRFSLAREQHYRMSHPS
jgi:hypothetical protein